MKVLIIGAGIGGLAAARALTADGHEVTVFEQAAGLRHGGAAVTLWSNGTGILGELGVALNGTGAPIDTLETRDAHGKLLSSFDVAQTAAHYGHPNICLPRTRLLGHLAEGLPAGMLAFGHACTGAEQDGVGVRARFADGTTASGDLLIGADGRGSVVRDQVWGGDPAQEQDAAAGGGDRCRYGGDPLPGGPAGELGRVTAPHLVADHRAAAVGADQQVAGGGRAVREPGADPRAVLLGTGTRVAEGQHAAGQPLGEVPEQPRAGQADVRVTVVRRGLGDIEAA